MADSEEIAGERGREDLPGHAQSNGPGQGSREAGNIVWMGEEFRNKSAKTPEIVSFNRRELDQILRVYGFKVAAGEWRDYAIDMLRDRAIFSVFRRTSEVPLHCIEKNPKHARKQGMWSVTGADGRILKRGHDLAAVLKVFDRKPKLDLV